MTIIACITRGKMIIDKLINYLDSCRDEPAGTIAFEGVSLLEAIEIWGIAILLLIFLIELTKYIKG
jgi:hypothetical protein